MAHGFEMHSQLMQFANAGVDVERPRVVARGNGARDGLQALDGARQAMTQNDGDGDRHGQISRQQPKHSSQCKLDSLLRRLLVEAQSQFGAMVRVLDWPHDEVNAVASFAKTQIRGTCRLDIRRSIHAAGTAASVVELRITGAAVSDREVEQVFDSLLGVHCRPDFEFVRKHP